MIKKTDIQRWLNHKIVKQLAWLTLILGSILRGSVWLQQRSIFLDEANLMRNYIEKSYVALFGHLDYQQYAPPLFSVVMKFCFQIFGVNELSAKLFPLLCGVAMLFVFYRLSRHFLSPFATLFALLFVCFDKIFIDYSTECKQYATDAFIAVLLLLLSQMIDFKLFNQKKAMLWAAIGSVAIWFSMPSIFVLAGVGAFYLFSFWRNKDTKAMQQIVAVGTIWLIQFALYFYFILKTDAQSDNLQDYHRAYFLAFPPLSINDLNLFITQIGGIFDRAIGITFLAAATSLLCFALGIKQLWQTNRAAFFLLTLPIFLTLAASACHYYSLIARLILFFLPIFILIVFIGFDVVLQKSHLIFSTVLTVAFISTIVLQIQILNPFQRFTNDYSELREGLDFIKKEKKADEVLFATYGITPVVRFYTKDCDRPYIFENLVLQEYVCCDPNIVENALIDVQKKGAKRIWLLGDQPNHGDLDKLIEKQNGRVLKQFEFHRGVALLYEIMEH
jgi:hypothetical protein